MNVLLATNNDHKRHELERILTDHRIVLPREIGIEFDFEESGTTFRENAFGKARALLEQLQAITKGGGAKAALGSGNDRPTDIDLDTIVIVADDSGLRVRALDGRPGIYSARYGAPDGGATELPSADRPAMLLGELLGATDRYAYFVCCMVALFSAERFGTAQETFEGEIAQRPSGGGGFGYDPVFLLPDRNLTVAELAAGEKDLISHRGKAARRLAGYLATVD